MYSTFVLLKCCQGNIADDISIKAAAKSHLLDDIKSQNVSALWCQTFWYSGGKTSRGVDYTLIPLRVKKIFSFKSF